MPVLRSDDPAAIAQAAQCLADGGLVGFPTETVYGLGARADDAAAVAAIYAAKGRPADHPLIVHVVDWAGAAAFADDLDHNPLAQRLAASFWPGPLTLIVRRRPGIAEAAAGGQQTIGLRCPAHAVAQALLRAAAALGVPGVAAPSANRFGRVSPTSAAHVRAEFGDDLLVLDGGDCEVGIESCIIDTSRGRPVLLRPGQLSRSTLEAALGEPLQAPDALAPRASGTLASHYAPRARVRLWRPAALHAALAALHLPHTVLDQAQQGLAVYSRRAVAAQPGLVWHRMPDTPAAVAHELFAVLRALDAEPVREIWVEEPPAEPAWDGVLDRLRRAAA